MPASLPPIQISNHTNNLASQMSPFLLDSPFTYRPRNNDNNDDDDSPIIIDYFAPKLDSSPTTSTSSSSSSDLDSVLSDRCSATAVSFLLTRSRVVKLCNLPELPQPYLSAVFKAPNEPNISHKNPTPVSIWFSNDSVWAVFRSHQDACAALSLSGPAMTVVPALETDLESLHNLQRLDLSLAPRRMQSQPDLFRSNPDLISKPNYPLSSNPPNPRSNFRLGDWICSSPNCAAHNFGRNLACIGCGSPRLPPQMSIPSSARHSPRFTSSPAQLSSFSLPTTPNSPSFPPVIPQGKGAHPLLTPSGRAFAIGGRVQNISSDPLAPCIMYWPDNEPFPEQGQIRPSNVVGVAPPILNTGNRGPISHQPGDWICKKCNYLNWRRRKVCQTCLPYAEGNGDSISAAVQAERIALLTAVLAQSQLSSSPAVPQPTAVRAQSMTPPQVQRPFIDVSPPHLRAPVHRSQSHFELSTQYSNSRPIYQTSGHRQPSPVYSTPSTATQDQYRLTLGNTDSSASLLPSFLQDIVTSPSLSPASTSSADLSFEEYSPTHVSFPRQKGNHLPHDSSSSSSSGGNNIWTLDGEETKSLSAFPLRNRSDLSGSTGSRKPSQEQLGH